MLATARQNESESGTSPTILADMPNSSSNNDYYEMRPIFQAMLKRDSLELNSLVRLEALPGLSPAPLERHLGIRSLFCGMTEGAVRTLHGDIREAIRANAFRPWQRLCRYSSSGSGKFPRQHSEGPNSPSSAASFCCQRSSTSPIERYAHPERLIRPIQPFGAVVTAA